MNYEYIIFDSNNKYNKGLTSSTVVVITIHFNDIPFGCGTVEPQSSGNFDMVIDRPGTKAKHCRVVPVLSITKASGGSGNTNYRTAYFGLAVGHTVRVYGQAGDLQSRGPYSFPGFTGGERVWTQHNRANIT